MQVERARKEAEIAKLEELEKVPALRTFSSLKGGGRDEPACARRKMLRARMMSAACVQ